MKQKTILYWTLSAVLYLGVVIGGYSIYTSTSTVSDNHEMGEEVSDDHSEANQEHSGETDQNTAHENDEINGHRHETDHSANGTGTVNEVNVNVGYRENKITIDLKDNDNKAPQLEVSHEKVMHLIVVSADLKDYYHLHPTEQGDGVFEQEIDLKDSSYKVFVDISPKDLAYQVSPVELHVGEGHAAHRDNQLQVDTVLEKTINDKTVELKIDSLVANHPTTLTFVSKDGKPDPYLGALGHVVILNENGEQFIHVHPVSDDATIFNTKFNQPGIYKLWAEFKFGEQVNTYPFVIKVN